MTIKDVSRRAFLKRLVQTLSTLAVAIGLWPFISSMQPSKKALEASKPIKVSLKGLSENEIKKVLWRGMPIYIIKRSPQQIKMIKVKNEQLLDPDSKASDQPQNAQNVFRSVREDVLVVVAVCTHLGCSPNYEPAKNAVDEGWHGGFFCACHGSKFDLSGRVFKGVPAPTNLLIPPYYFMDDETIVIGSEAPSYA